MSREELLAALVAERQDLRWFPTPTKTADDISVDRDNDVVCARRRRVLVSDDMERGRWVTRRGVQVWEVVA